MITAQQIQEQIASAIKYGGLKEKEIAQKIGVSQQIISDYARKKKMPSLDTFANLCEVLGLDANDALCLKRFTE